MLAFDRNNAQRIDFEGDETMGIRVMGVIDHADGELRERVGYVGRVPAFDR